MGLFPGYNDEGAGLEFALSLLEAEREAKGAPPEPEEIVLTRRLCHALDLDTIRTKLVALRVLAKCIRDGVVTRNDLAALRKSADHERR